MVNYPDEIEGHEVKSHSSSNQQIYIFLCTFIIVVLIFWNVWVSYSGNKAIYNKLDIINFSQFQRVELSNIYNNYSYENCSFYNLTYLNETFYNITNLNISYFNESFYNFSYYFENKTEIYNNYSSFNYTYHSNFENITNIYYVNNSGNFSEV